MKNGQLKQEIQDKAGAKAWLNHFLAKKKWGFKSNRIVFQCPGGCSHTTEALVMFSEFNRENCTCPRLVRSCAFNQSMHVTEVRIARRIQTGSAAHYAIKWSMHL